MNLNLTKLVAEALHNNGWTSSEVDKLVEVFGFSEADLFEIHCVLSDLEYWDKLEGLGK